MCGIAGIVGQGRAGDRVARVAAMTRALAHRGPDGEGQHNAAHVSLGHRRLAIIDPASGKQPLCNEDETVWLSYNGEIYNYRELRQQLISHGHRFKTDSDSEVIVHAWEEWGPSCVERLRGMFAFGLVDQTKQRLFLARDHLGIKPLCYHVGEERVTFASEINAVLHGIPTMPDIDLQAIDYFLRYRYIPAPDSGYVGVRKMPPATYQLYDFRGRLIEEREYWQLEFDVSEEIGRDNTEKVAEQITDEFEQTLMESVEAHLVADVPFGAFLSGGVDSTLVVACMAKLLGKDVNAYTIDFEENGYSEKRFASEAAERLGINLHCEVVRPNVLNALETLFTNYGEPFADTSAIPTWWVCELARRDVPMVLSGDGADEAFAGYTRYQRWQADSWEADIRAFAKYPKRLLRRLRETYAAFAQRRLANLRLSRWQTHFVGVVDERTRAKLWSSDLRSLVTKPNPAFAKAGFEARFHDKLSFSQYVDINTYLPGDILTKVDIASMQHGLEVRTPFTDVRVMEFAAKLPTLNRFDPDFGANGRLKATPKRALRRTFPGKFVDRKKMGFAIPEANWLRPGNPVRQCFDDLLASKQSTFCETIDPLAIQNMLRAFDDRGVHATELWSLFALGFWMNQAQPMQTVSTTSHGKAA